MPTPEGPTSTTRICIVLTLAEASALVTQFQLDPQAAALNGFVKILTALRHVTAEVTSPPSSALDVPPLRAKHYRQSTEALRMAKATLSPTVSIDAAAAPEPRMAKAVMRPKVPTTRTVRAARAPELDDDYVPYRDEADGVYT